MLRENVSLYHGRPVDFLDLRRQVCQHSGRTYEDDRAECFAVIMVVS